LGDERPNAERIVGDKKTERPLRAKKKKGGFRADGIEGGRGQMSFRTISKCQARKEKRGEEFVTET